MGFRRAERSGGLGMNRRVGGGGACSLLGDGKWEIVSGIVTCGLFMSCPGRHGRTGG